MPRRLGSERLALAAATATIPLIGALVLWVAGLALVDGTACPEPRNDQIGLEADRSLWPPGADCTDGSVAQAFDGLTTVLAALIASTLVVLAAGAVAAAKHRGQGSDPG